jgi:hypothetical protein
MSPTSTKPYSKTEFLADPGFDKYDTDPKPRNRQLRFLPNQNSADIVLLNKNQPEPEPDTFIGQEGMSSLYPMLVEEEKRGMDIYTNIYVSSLSIVGLYILFRVLYR